MNIDLEHGGQGEFLWLLQNLKLGNWHPRQLEKTEEAVEQQRLSGDAIAQWCHACISADAIIGLNSGAGEPLGRDISTESLRESFTIFCKQHGLRPPSNDLLGKAMTR
ncbi:MAG: hypothetical protein ACWGPR_12740, partial [Candidatus Deferrimicrobiaceae bacterium]